MARIKSVSHLPVSAEMRAIIPIKTVNVNQAIFFIFLYKNKR